MNRNIRVISLSLLLALVLSVFGIFASFAEEATAPAQEYGKLMFDFDATQNKTLTHPTGASLIKKEAADGSPYWSYSIPGKDPTAGGGNGDYLDFSSWKEYINISTGVDAEGNPVTDPNKQKNTDFLVIDFDISTDTTFIDGMYFHTSFYSDGYSTSKDSRTNVSGLYFDLDGAYGDTLSIGNSEDAKKTYAYNTTSGDKWTDVTFVYDFRTEGKATVYIYMNGIYAGKTTEVDLSYNGRQSRRLYFLRLTTPVQSQYDTNTNFANFTVKRFGVGYDGPLTDTNFGLGKTGATLDTMPDLAYCLEDKPEENLKKLATVTHSDGKSYDAYEFDELDANLVDGDVVTLYKNVAYPLIVPEGANITFKDEAGNILTPGTRNSADLVGLVEPSPLDYSAGPFVTRDRRTMKTIKQLTATNFATAFDVKNQGSVIYTLLADTEATFDAEGRAEHYPIIDINGHTFELGVPLTSSGGASSKRAVTGGANIRIANGSFLFVGGGADFSMPNSYSIIAFENLDLFMTKRMGATFLDQRGGVVLFKDIKSIEREAVASGKTYIGATLSSMKSSRTMISRVIVDNCTLNTTAVSPTGKNVTSNEPFSTINYSTGGVRYAGQNSNISFVDTVANLGNDALIEIDVNTHTEGTITAFANDETKKNELVSFAINETASENNVHNINVEISNTEITTTAGVLGMDTLNVVRGTGAIKDDNNKTTHSSVNFSVDNNKLHINLDVNVDNCDIEAATLLKAYNSFNYNPEINTDYTYDVNVAVSGETNLDMSSNILVNESTSLGYETLDINLDGEILLPDSFTNKDSRFTYSVAAPALLVPRNEGYAVTADKVQSYPYILGDHEYEFYWFAGETVSVDKIPVELPASSKYFSYSWAGPNDDGAYYAVVRDTIPVKANVSLYSDFILNIYLPTDLGTDCYKSLTLDGADTKVTLVAVDGVEYMKVSVADINPATAADATELAFKVEDGSLEATIVKSISVVDYLESALNNATSDTEAKLIVSMINYVDKAYQYVTPDGEELPESLTSLTSSAKYTAYTIDKLTDMTATKTVADLGVFEEVSISLNNAFRFTFKTKADFEGNLVFSYVKNGRLFVETKRCVGEREITLELKANELLQNITVSYGDTVGEYNLAAYLEWTKTTENAELVSLVEALWLYADYAKAYVAAVNP